MKESPFFDFSTDPICQVDLKEYKVIKEYSSLEKVYEDIGENGIVKNFRSGFLKCLKGESLTFHGFAWIRKSESLKVNMREYVDSKKVKVKSDKPPISVADFFENVTDKLCKVNLNKQKIVQVYENIDKVVEDVKKDGETKANDSTIKRAIAYCLMGDQKRYFNYAWGFEADIIKVGLEEFCQGRLPKNSSNKKVIESAATETKIEREKELDNYVDNSLEVEKGFMTELYMYRILIESKLFEKVELMGASNGDGDILITINGVEKILQVKTLSYAVDKKVYYVSKTKHYTRNILVASVSLDRKIFNLIFSDDNKGGTCINYKNLLLQYKDITFNDMRDFLKRLWT